MRQKETLRQAQKNKVAQEKMDKITKIVAIIFAFASVYYFFIKLLFL